MLAVRNVEVVYDDVILVLRGVSLDVPDGKIVALLGANGAGKTTLLRAVSGLLDIHYGKLTKGSVTVDGEPIHCSSPARIVKLGVKQAMEGRRIFAELTVDENLRVGAHTNTRQLRKNLDRVYELFPRLRERPKATAGYLSGGEQQMLAMGRALMSDPRYLLLDEPSLGLAPLLVRQIRDLIVEIN
ncbi:MAG TPA: ATP-binding cassette domain-containing protein, partial [Micromonosporaceae bacterium]|nr:ATP-binding cassette domain-containing protein [Micromonosporaceae bacterium]